MSYVDHAGLATAPGPLVCRDATLFAFRLQADAARLESECDRIFAQPTGGAVRARPLGSHVLLAFARLGQVVPLTAPYDTMGFVQEREAVLFVPVLATARPGRRMARRRPIPGRFGALSHAEIAGYVAMLLLDNPISIAAGREIYGYPKACGWAIFPAAERRDQAERDIAAASPAPVQPQDFAVDAFAFANSGAASQPGRHRLLTLTPSGDPAGRRLGGPRDLVRAAHGAGLGQRMAGRVLGLLGPQLPALTVRQLFLRQLRAAGGGLGADFQQVVDAPATVTRWGEAARLGSYRLQVEDLASQKTPADLGILSGQTASGVRLTFDFEVGPGRSLWGG